MAVFAGKSPITNGGANDRAILNSFYQYRPSIYQGQVGNVRHVYSGATGTATGVSPTDAYTGLQAAHDASTADNDDIVLVLPGHAEAVIAAGTIAMTKAGIIYQGVGTGQGRPIISFSTISTAQMTITGARTTFRNLVFDFTGVSAIVAAISITAADVAFEDCSFIISTGTNAPVLGILTAATAARFRVERCTFLGPATSTDTCTAAIKHEVGINFLFRDNYFIGKFTQAILNATTILGGEISGNRFQIYTGTKGVALAAGTTGFGHDNKLVVPSGTSPVVGAGFSWTANSYTTEALTIGTPTAVAF